MRGKKEQKVKSAQIGPHKNRQSNAKNHEGPKHGYFRRGHVTIFGKLICCEGKGDKAENKIDQSRHGGPDCISLRLQSGAASE